MIGQEIDDDKDWKNYLLHLKIIDYIAPVVSDDMPAYLRELIQDHHLAFKALYPTAPIIPKMHYMIHYPKWMVRLVFP